MKAVLLFLLGITFGVLLFGGYMINKEKPPIPKVVKTEDGQILFTEKDIIDGQNYYFSRGGQHIGTVWGHGSYLAPDWSADYIHRSGLFMAARLAGIDSINASQFRQDQFDELEVTRKAQLTAMVTRDMKKNRFDATTGELIYDKNQADAFRHLSRYYTKLFRDGLPDVGLQPGIVTNDREGFIVTSFFSWLAWAAVTERLGTEATYTSNWPYDPLVGNEPRPDSVIWSIVSVILLLLGIGVFIFYYLHYLKDDENPELIVQINEPAPTPSQRATVIFFIIAMALFVIQMLTGSLTGHFTVEGTKFFGIDIGNILPYAAVRTWHIQLSIFWIATCFLATGLFIGPFVGKEPNKQKFWVITLFAAVVVVVLGTLTGNWLSVTGAFGGDGFYLGHQGYEYIEIGRIWQLLLIIGMIIWLVLVLRAILPAIKNEKDKGGLTHLLLYSSVTIPLFYMAGLLYGKGTHLSVAEYWRWWVVHLWVEGFFEVFATVVLAFILSRIGAVSLKFASKMVYISVFLYLGSGVVGTFHHLYWTGTPSMIIALGAVFSALEVVPLTLLGFEAAHNLKLIEKGGPNYDYKWPIYFFIAVAFWNLLGAGVFGFLINPPIVLYYIQGINTTPIHAHTALFGVYGLLAIALMLFSMRHIVKKISWSDKLLKWSFWGLNGGLMAMSVFSLIPSGFYQFYYAVKYGMWYARSPEITTSETMKLFSWMRVVPDMIFIAGGVLILVFVIRAGWISFVKKEK